MNRTLRYITLLNLSKHLRTNFARLYVTKICKWPAFNINIFETVNPGEFQEEINTLFLGNI